ncbi:MAG: hypothetical protein HY695_29160 [Deltaproteobacteria bacterium]|nr:hypothetical protein [Deltaproteobacteria bacterium]
MKARKRIKIRGHEVQLSNLEKLMYPAVGFTKRDVIDYYRRASRYILPHIKDRPVTMKRYPDGVEGEHFYEKDAPSYTPEWVKTFPILRTSGEEHIDYILINDLPTLIWSANMANLEIHSFLARAPKIDSPTMVVFDLDPGEGADILQSCEVAFLLKALLARLNLQCLAKVSGSKGIHIHIPLNSSASYVATQSFAKAIALSLEQEHPNLIVSEMPKRKRKGKVFIDWSQNSDYKSTVAPYSLRAKGERPFVAMPARWDELKRALRKADSALLFFEPEAALVRMKKSGDIFAPVLTLKQELPKAFLRLEDPDLGRAAQSNESLRVYREKRDFSKTPEPPPSAPRPTPKDGKRLFVVQKHAASHLHYDLRLEMHGVLKSWAVPKGPPFELNEKRLAMATEDHPLEYARFEGVIPQGEYGGGTVMVWDIGDYQITDGNYYQGKLHLIFSGKKLNGEWVLVKPEQRNGKENWFLIKVGSPAKPPSAKTLDLSALSSRSMEQIAQAGGPVWHSNKAAQGERDGGKPDRMAELESLPQARAGFVNPMLAQPSARLPEDPSKWIYEIKLDGYRCVASKNKAKVSLFSRNGRTLNSRFPNIVRAVEQIETGTVIDGEIIALDEQGRPSFNALQDYRPESGQALFYIFDLLTYRRRSLLTLPLRRRREILKSAISGLADAVKLSEDFADPEDLAKAAGELGLEGIIAKRADSFYEPGERSGAWLKYRINKGQEFVIGGYIPGSHGFDSLLVGYYEKHHLLFISKIRNGFVRRTRREIFGRIKKFETRHCPFENLPEKKGSRRGEALTADVMKKCRWLKPRLVAQIEFTEWTEGNRLRHAKFAGLREDKDPREVIREYPAARDTLMNDTSDSAVSSS